MTARSSMAAFLLALIALGAASSSPAFSEPSERSRPTAARGDNPAPTLGPASLRLDQQVHLGPESHFFRNGDVLLWDDELSLALGANALASQTVGGNNTALGSRALRYLDDGVANTALGWGAGGNLLTGFENTAIGSNAMFAAEGGNGNTTVGALSMGGAGDANAALGALALNNKIDGSSNTAIGDFALGQLTYGDSNVGIGGRAGLNLISGRHSVFIASRGADESHAIRLGSPFDDQANGDPLDDTGQRATYIAGIQGATLNGMNEHPVCVDDEDRLGVCSESSARFKRAIEGMGSLSRGLHRLRPVVFRYRPEAKKGPSPLEYGLIAEEVAEVFPHLVRYDPEGRPLTLRYDLLTPLLLNELQRQHREVLGLKWAVALMVLTGVVIVGGSRRKVLDQFLGLLRPRAQLPE